MSFAPNPRPLPSFGLTFSAAKNTTVARDLSQPFRRDINTTGQAFSTLNFKNTQNTRSHATFCYTNDASDMFSDVDVETQSFSSVKEIPPRQFFGQKIADAVLLMLSSVRSFGRRIIRH